MRAVVVVLAGTQSGVEPLVVRLLVAGVPVGAVSAQIDQGGRRHHPGRHHHRQPGDLTHGGHQLGERREVPALVHRRILAHGQVEQVDARCGQVAADRHNLFDWLAVARTLAVAAAVEAERAAIATVGGEVDEAVREDDIAEVAPAQLARRGEERLPRLAVGCGEQPRQLPAPECLAGKGAAAEALDL